MPAPLLVPIRIEIHQHVDPTIQFTPRVPVEIGVNGQAPARQNLMKGTAFEVRIRDEPFNPGEFFQEVDKRKAIELIQHVSYEGRQSHEEGLLNST